MMFSQDCAVEGRDWNIKRLTARMSSQSVFGERGTGCSWRGGKTSKDVIDCLTRQIDKDRTVGAEALRREGVFIQLVTLPGVETFWGYDPAGDGSHQPIPRSGQLRFLLSEGQ